MTRADGHTQRRCRSGTKIRTWRWSALVAAVCAAVVAAGCTPHDISRTYGKRGTLTADSVNGTNVLSTMFEQAGHKVLTRERLSPRLDTFQTLIWFPDTPQPPSRDEREYLEGWLSRGPDRTLIYVGRDYDAAVQYWRKVRQMVPPADHRAVDKRMNEAVSDYLTTRAQLPVEAYARWFVVRSNKPSYRVTGLRGPWAEGIDATKTEIDLNARFDLPTADDLNQAIKNPTAQPTTFGMPAKVSARNRSRRPAKSRPAFLPTPADSVSQQASIPEAEVLLATDVGDPLVTRLTQDDEQRYGLDDWPDGQLIVVTNGSFLVNFGLVNHEHRKLAERLVAACGPAGRVGFLESGVLGLEIMDREPTERKSTGFELFLIFPLNAILLHLVAAGILVCFARMPIFGRPKNLPKESMGDFGAHIVAAGELLSWSRDAAFARNKIEQYRQKMKATTTSRHTGPVAAPDSPPTTTPPAALPAPTQDRS